MTPIQKKLAELREKSKAATERPWRHETHDCDARGTGLVWQSANEGFYNPNIKTVCKVVYTNGGSHHWDYRTLEESEATSEFIVTACNSYDILLEVIGELSGALTKIGTYRKDQVLERLYLCGEDARNVLTKAQELLEKIEK